MAEFLSTYQAAEALGVSVTTIKRWVDDKLLPSHKTVGGHRKLAAADVRQFARENGLAVTQVEENDVAAVRWPRLLSFLRKGDVAGANSLLRLAQRGGMTLDAVADNLVAPALARLGEDWECQRIDVYQEHSATQVCAAALYSLQRDLPSETGGARPLALGGAPEGDHYVMPSLLAGMTLHECGWHAVNLGPNTPAASFVRAITDLRPRLLWLSASHLADPAAFLLHWRDVHACAERFGVAVAVGGQALTDPVRRNMNYTTFGDKLQHLAAFARTLHAGSRRPRRGRPPRAP